MEYTLIKTNIEDMIADVVKALKEIQIELFNKELNNLRKGKPYTNESFQLSLIIDLSDCIECCVLEKYLNYYINKLNNNGKL